MTDQFKNDLSAAERLADLVKPPSFDEAPTTTRPTSPDNWYDDLEDFEAHLEYFGWLKTRKQWTLAELGALLLPSLELEMLLSHTAPQNLAKLHPGLGEMVSHAVKSRELSANDEDGQRTIDPGTGIVWLLTQVPRLHQVIADLDVQSGAGDNTLKPSTQEQAVKTVVTVEDKHLLFTLHLADGSTKLVRFDKPKPGKEPPLTYRIVLVLLRNHEVGGVEFSRDMLTGLGNPEWKNLCSTFRTIRKNKFPMVPDILPLLPATPRATIKGRPDRIRFNLENLIIPAVLQGEDEDARVRQRGASLDNSIMDRGKDRALAFQDPALERLINDEE